MYQYLPTVIALTIINNTILILLIMGNMLLIMLRSVVLIYYIE